MPSDAPPTSRPSRSSICRPASATPSSPRRSSSRAKPAPRFSGVLCGRATWKDGIPVYGKQGAAAFKAWLDDQGVKNISNVNDHLKPAQPWFEFYGAKSADELR